VQVAPESGGRIASIEVDGIDLLLTAADADGPGDFGVFPMAPWAGRVRDGKFSFNGEEHQLTVNMPPHAIHGTVRDGSWVIDDSDEHEARISCPLGRGWPWRGWCEQTFTLYPDRLEVRMSVLASGDPFPASAGWHPWFRKTIDGHEAEIDLPAQSMYKRDDDGIPTGDLVTPSSRPWDDCFTDLSGPPGLRWGDGLAVSIETDCPCLVVYDERANAVCVEPQTGPPDALNIAPVVVEPEKPLTAGMTIKWESPGSA
jgi:galactose mutarotase-like enzyme